MEASENWIQSADQPTIAQPGTTFNYCSGAVQSLLAALEKTSGMSARESANQSLSATDRIDPLSLNQPGLPTRREDDRRIGLALTSRDMAKIGFLFLNQAMGRRWCQLYASASTSRQVRDKKGIKIGGYLWWIDSAG
jgi:CubicO group peptidase (beta-lactamase class C family)